MNISYWLSAAGVAAFIVAIFAVAIHDSNKWDKFKIDHHCKVVGKIDGDVFNTIGSDGKVGIGFTSGKTGWLCDDGVTYWK